MEDASLFNIYIEKQRKFISLVKEVQNSFNSKEYQKHGCSFKEFTRKKWNISQAQAYRYIMCAKVIDQLDEFEIKPSYESLCKSLNNVATSPVQMKLLWSKILQKTNNRPDCINSTHVNQYWKELCMDKKYSKICHYKDENDIMAKIEKSLNKFSNEKKHKQIHQSKTSDNQIKNEQTKKKQNNSINTNTNTNTNKNINKTTNTKMNIKTKTTDKVKVEINTPVIPSPAQSESSNASFNYINSSTTTTKEPIIYSNDSSNSNSLYSPLPLTSLDNTCTSSTANELILTSVPSQNEPSLILSNNKNSLSPLSLSTLNPPITTVPCNETSLSPLSLSISSLNPPITTVPSNETSSSFTSLSLSRSSHSSTSLSPLVNSIQNLPSSSVPPYIPCNNTVSTSPQAFYYLPIQNEFVYSYPQPSLTQFAYTTSSQMQSIPQPQPQQQHPLLQSSQHQQQQQQQQQRLNSQQQPPYYYY